jgi:hypothetical protein
MPHASRKDYEIALAGLDFPTSKAAVINRARDNGGIDNEVFDTVARLPDTSFETLEELHQAIRDIYVADGVRREALPI